ncbi:hypothetical protein GGTG_12228 [Gaeumannomyces tritici R3-111a-1]|uniref:F-box domain-containing protein n=1 Tax=Gaeumannomyces tritici (strain R3-111a-1) TaxID=644352 RepID=J3PFF1_GAET3|nr:hypothetical protein GGTG_12228 [Gaeumannomyces tritici R3-111a-1]EJT70054.1 hypothetical protein GGTG_12228 [Gaeumannomyces tritici R3-111a-1]
MEVDTQSQSHEPAPDPPVLKLSAELVLCIADYLSIGQSAALFLTCKRLYPLIRRLRFRALLRDLANDLDDESGNSPWIHNSDPWGSDSLPYGSNLPPWLDDPFAAAAAESQDRRLGRVATTGDPEDDLMELLRLLERDTPGHFLCMTGCHILHPYDQRRDRSFTCPYEPRDCEEAECSTYVTGFKLVRPQYIISASHIHRTFRHVRTRGWTGSPVSSLAASTTWSQWSGGPGEDDPYYFDSSRTWRKLVVEPVVKRSTGHVLVHIAQHCWTWNGANNDETPGPFPAIDPDSCWGDKADPDDEFDLWNFLPASPERAFQGPRLPWWANELLEPCVHMLQRDEIGHLRQRLCKKPWGPPRRQVLRAIEAFMAEREREQPPSPPPSSSLPSSSSSSSSSSSLSVFDNWEPGTDGGSPRRAAPTTRARHVRSVCPECPTEVLLTEIVYGADSGDLAEGAEVMLDSWQDFSCRLPADPPGRHGRVPTRCVYRCWPVRHMPPVPVPLQPLDRGSDNDDDEDDDDDEVEGGYDLDSDASSVRSGQHYWSSERKSVFRTRGGIGAAINLITEAPQALLTWRDPEFMADYNDP